MSEAVDGRPGQRRDASRDRAIHQAVLEILSEYGYHELTIDALIAKARVSKGTVYHRWPGKNELVIDTITSFSEKDLTMPDTGSLREDLIAVLNKWRKTLTGLGGIFVAVIAELPRNPELADICRVEISQRARDMMEAVLRRWNDRGEIHRDTPFALVSELAGAILIYRLMVTRAPLSKELVNILVDEVLLPFLCTCPTPAEPPLKLT